MCLYHGCQVAKQMHMSLQNTIQIRILGCCGPVSRLVADGEVLVLEIVVDFGRAETKADDRHVSGHDFR